MKRLLDVLREDLHLTGTKEGCGEGECGACAVLLDGDLVNSCLVPALQANGARLCTIEGVSVPKAVYTPIQQVLPRSAAERNAASARPGMILATQHLLDKYPNPTTGADPGRPWQATCADARVTCASSSQCRTRLLR